MTQDRKCLFLLFDNPVMTPISQGVFKLEYTYNNLNMLLSLVNKKSDATVISSFSYTHDKVGNRLTMATPEGTHNYAYDSLYRLSSADHPVQADEAYTYDKVGNRKTSSQYSNWSFDANNRLLSFNGTSFTYDKNGNTLSKTKDAQTTSYTYDFENRLIAGTVPAGGLSLSYSYDPFGKRLSKTVGGVTKYYLYDNEDIIAEYDADGNLIASYVHGQGIDEPISMTRGSSTYYYTFDGLGTVSELTDSGQAVVESYKYDAFGKLETPPATGNPYTYTAREYDPESGLYFYRARYYDAVIGRFITPDPLWFRSSGIKFYVYVNNNPVNLVDPQGLYCERVLSIPKGRHRTTEKEDITKGPWVLTYANVESASGLIPWGNLICKWTREIKVYRFITEHTTWWNLDFCCDCSFFGLMACNFQTSETVTINEFEQSYTKLEHTTTGASTFIEAIPSLRCLADYKPYD